MNEYKMLMPVCDNSGAPVDYTVFLQDVLRIFGGYTLGPVCEGVWYDSAAQVTYTDEARALYIASRDAGSVAEMARRLCVVARQVCVYLRGPAGDVAFISGPAGEASNDAA